MYKTHRYKLTVSELLSKVMDQRVEIHDFRPVVKQILDRFGKVVIGLFVGEVHSPSTALLLLVAALQWSAVEDELHHPDPDLTVLVGLGAH